jgi:hypothetical protein
MAVAHSLATILKNNRDDSMRTLKSYTIGIILLISCLSWTTKRQDLIAKTNETTIDLKKIGSEILNGRKIATIDTLLIYQLIDSVLAKESKDREFYFKVFIEINHQAKGEIAVAIDWKIKDFCSKYPNEFFNISDSEIKDYSRRIGELFRTEEEYPLESAQKYVNDIKKRTNPVYHDKANIFSKELIKKVKGGR